MGDRIPRASAKWKQIEIHTITSQMKLEYYIRRQIFALVCVCVVVVVVFGANKLNHRIARIIHIRGDNKIAWKIKLKKKKKLQTVISPYLHHILRRQHCISNAHSSLSQVTTINLRSNFQCKFYRSRLIYAANTLQVSEWQCVCVMPVGTAFDFKIKSRKTHSPKWFEHIWKRKSHDAN